MLRLVLELLANSASTQIPHLHILHLHISKAVHTGQGKLQTRFAVQGDDCPAAVDERAAEHLHVIAYFEGFVGDFHRCLHAAEALDVQGLLLAEESVATAEVEVSEDVAELQGFVAAFLTGSDEYIVPEQGHFIEDPAIIAQTEPLLGGHASSEVHFFEAFAYFPLRVALDEQHAPLDFFVDGGHITMGM